MRVVNYYEINCINRSTCDGRPSRFYSAQVYCMQSVTRVHLDIWVKAALYTGHEDRRERMRRKEIIGTLRGAIRYVPLPALVRNERLLR